MTEFDMIEKELEEFSFNEMSDFQIENGLGSIADSIKESDEINDEEAGYLLDKLAEVEKLWEEL